METLKVDKPPKPIEMFEEWYERRIGRPLPILNDKYIVLENSDVYILAIGMQKDPKFSAVVMEVKNDYEFKTEHDFTHNKQETDLADLVEARKYCQFKELSLDAFQGETFSTNNQPFYRRFEGKHRKHKGHGKR